MNGTISINLEGATFTTTERCRKIIHELFEAGIFNVRNGKVTINFDQDGIMTDVKLDKVLWKRGHQAIPLSPIYKNAKIEIKKTELFESI